MHPSKERIEDSYEKANPWYDDSFIEKRKRYDSVGTCTEVGGNG